MKATGSSSDTGPEKKLLETPPFTNRTADTRARNRKIRAAPRETACVAQRGICILNRDRDEIASKTRHDGTSRKAACFPVFLREWSEYISDGRHHK